MNKFTEILQRYFYRHSERLSQHAETTGEEARLILKDNFCSQPKSILKDNVKIFHFENLYSKLIIGFNFAFTQLI